MYIEFKLPHAGGAHATAQAIKLAVARWAAKYDVPQHDYSEKTIKYTHRLGFNKEKYFSFLRQDILLIFSLVLQYLLILL